MESWKFAWQQGDTHHQLLWLHMVSLNSSFLTRNGSRSILRSRFPSHDIYTQAMLTCELRLTPEDVLALQSGQSRRLDETGNVHGIQE